MKRVIFFLFILFIGLESSAQLQNTAWKGMFNVPYPIEGSFVFKSDTLELYLPEAGGLAETMKFHTNEDTLFISKLSGKSSCWDVEDAQYSYKIENHLLHLTALKDECSMRVNAFPVDGLELLNREDK